MARKVRKTANKETLADGIARVRLSDPEHANDYQWIAAMLQANPDAVKEQLSQIHQRELAREVGALPQTFELKAIGDSLLKMELTTEQVFAKLGELVVGQDVPDGQDVRNFATIGKHLLAVLRTKMDIVLQARTTPVERQPGQQHKQISRTSGMTPITAGH